MIMDQVGQDLREIDVLDGIDSINSRLDVLFDKLEDVKDTLNLEEKAELSTKILDKFDDYMRNIEKLNSMVNELKGQVAIVRAGMRHTQDESKQMHKRYKEALKGLFKGLQETDSE